MQDDSSGYEVNEVVGLMQEVQRGVRLLVGRQSCLGPEIGRLYKEINTQRWVQKKKMQWVLEENSHLLNVALFFPMSLSPSNVCQFLPIGLFCLRLPASFSAHISSVGLHGVWQGLAVLLGSFISGMSGRRFRIRFFLFPLGVAVFLGHYPLSVAPPGLGTALTAWPQGQWQRCGCSS